MNTTRGLLVLNRMALMRRAESAGVLSSRIPAVKLAPVEVFKRYRGFDGQPWPDLESRNFDVRDGVADLAALPAVGEYLRRISNADECEIVLLEWLPPDAMPLACPGWSSAGFDLGYYDSEWSYFSIVLNEILFGVYDELRRFGNGLNPNLLIPNADDVQGILESRQRLVDAGKDLEEVPNAQLIHVLIPETGI